MRGYQVRAANKLYHGNPVRDKDTGVYQFWRPERDGTAVHIDMGLGKTIIGLTAITDWFLFGIVRRPVLVIAPIKVCESVWRQEAKGWQHTQHLTFELVRGTERDRAFALRGVTHPQLDRKPPHVYLINPELLQWLAKFLRNDFSYFDAMLIDESSMFKDNRSKRFRSLSNYGTRVALKDEKGVALRDKDGHLVMTPPHRFVRSGVLTGTPSPSSLMNLWAPVYLVDHGARLQRKFETFQGRYFHKTQQVAEHVHKYDINDTEDEARPEFEAREGSPERIHELIADITIELNAEDYGILPQTIGDLSKTAYGSPLCPPSHVHRIDLPDALMAQYKILERDAIIELNKDVVMAQNGGAKSMMCWQIANGALYSIDEFGRQQWTELHTGKLDKLCELTDTISANAMIPYWFRHDLARIKARFDKEGIPYAVLTSKNSERIIDRWNGGYTPNLLIHPQSAAHGLNLQFGGHHLLWFTMLWSLERYLQTNARLARSGQPNVVGIHSIIARGTTDELMAMNLGENGDDQQRFRAALRSYQKLHNLGLYDSNPLAGLGI